MTKVDAVDDARDKFGSFQEYKVIDIFGNDTMTFVEVRI